jgi:hypothetical protein
LNTEAYELANNLLDNTISSYNFMVRDPRIIQLAKAAPGAVEILYIITDEGEDIVSERMSYEELDHLLSLKIKPLLDELINNIEGSLCELINEYGLNRKSKKIRELYFPESYKESSGKHAKNNIMVNESIVSWSKRGSFKNVILLTEENPMFRRLKESRTQKQIKSFFNFISRSSPNLIANISTPDIERLLSVAVTYEAPSVLTKMILRDPVKTQLAIEGYIALKEQQDYLEEEEGCSRESFIESLFYTVHDWVITETENNGENGTLAKLSFEKALQKALEWEQNCQEMEKKENELRMEAIFPKPIFEQLKIENYTLNYISNGSELFDEGTKMDHCVFEFWEDCNDGNSFMYSLRNLEGKRIATLKLEKDGKIEQFFGKQNHPIKEALKNKVCNAIEQELAKTKEKELVLC